MVIGKGYETGQLSEAEVRELAAKGSGQIELRGKRVLVIIPDSTRSCPLPFFFRLLCELIRPKAKKLDFLIALGTHPPMAEDKINALLGLTPEERAAKYADVRIFNHETLPFDENMKATAAYVERHRDKVVVEGAVDEIFESGTGEQKNQITTVAQAKRFVEATGCDLIVPNLGTEHRASARELRYHGDQAQAIRGAVGKLLVLHGTSSLSPADFTRLKDDGIIKVNIWTAIEKAGAQSCVRKALDELGNTFTEGDLMSFVDTGVLGPACLSPRYRDGQCGGRFWPKLDHFAEAVRRDAWVAGAQPLVEACLRDLGYEAFGR